MVDHTGNIWTNRAGAYTRCSHSPCSKKASPVITDHDCCGRCRRAPDCLALAQESYDGPGTFDHKYFEVMLRPGVCDICGEPPERHRR